MILKRHNYDSIKREQIVETLKFYKIDSNIINSVVSIYTGDETTITLRDNVQLKLSISSGIRQGCTLSTTIFKMITYCELAERTSIREARELLFNIWGLERRLSRKLSIFDIWCVEQKMFVFTWISKVCHKKIWPSLNLTLIECFYLGKYDT